MADGVNLIKTEIISSSDREYLTEWPPVNEICELESCVKRKRPRINREESAREDNSCIAQFVSREDDHESRTLWARPALARWWRRRQKERSEYDFAKLPKSSNPNTLLRFVAGFVFTVFCDPTQSPWEFEILALSLFDEKQNIYRTAIKQFNSVRSCNIHEIYYWKNVFKFLKHFIVECSCTNNFQRVIVLRQCGLCE